MYGLAPPPRERRPSDLRLFLPPRDLRPDLLRREWGERMEWGERRGWGERSE